MGLVRKHTERNEYTDGNLERINIVDDGQYADLILRDTESYGASFCVPRDKWDTFVKLVNSVVIKRTM